MKAIGFLAAVLALVPAAPAGAANAYKAMAKEFSRSAVAKGLGGVAVLPFLPADGGRSGEGLNISEKLTTQLVRLGGVKTVEREMLGRLMEEHRLARTGMLDESGLRRLGKILSVDAVVTGTFAVRGGRLTVNARLIDVESGVILAACEQSVAREWTDGGRGQGFALIGLPTEDRCAQDARRADALEESILDLKARHWAYLIKKGLSLEQLEKNLGTLMENKGLASRFYGRVTDYREAVKVAELSEAEARRFMDADQKAFALRNACGLESGS